MRSVIRRFSAASLVALTLCAAAPGAQAGPINIVGGDITYSRSNTAFFDLILTNGDMRGHFGDFGSEWWNPPHVCFACAPGSTINPSLVETFTAAPHDDIAVSGTLRFDERTFNLTGLTFSVLADDVRVPNTFNTNTDGTAVRSTVAQFALHGLATGWTPDRFSGVGLALLGHGKVQLLFENDNWFATVFTFEDPATVPEPTSLLLFGTGALAIAARRRGARRQGCLSFAAITRDPASFRTRSAPARISGCKTRQPEAGLQAAHGASCAAGYAARRLTLRA